MTLGEFEKKFNTEEACRDYLFELRWPKGFECPKCGNNKAWPIGNVLFECSKCNHQTSVIVGTIFQGTHKPLTLWFRAIWWVTTQKNGASALGLQRIFGFEDSLGVMHIATRMYDRIVKCSRPYLQAELNYDDSGLERDKLIIRQGKTVININISEC